MAIVRRGDRWYDNKKGKFVKGPAVVQEEVSAPAPEPVVQTLHEAPHAEREITAAEAVWHNGESFEIEGDDETGDEGSLA